MNARKGMLMGLLMMGMIVAADAIFFWGSGCYFSDEETSYDNTITVGIWATPTPEPTPNNSTGNGTNATAPAPTQSPAP